MATPWNLGLVTQLAGAVLVLMNNCFSGCEPSPFHPITITITCSARHFRATFVPSAVQAPLLIQAPMVKDRWFWSPRFAQPCLADAASLGIGPHRGLATPHKSQATAT
jgi:hypothetical protein